MSRNTGLLIAVVMVIGAFLPSYAAGDDMTLKGIPLKDQEMNEIYGGFQTPDGNLLYFSMDFMRVRFLSQSGPDNSSSGANTPAWMNALSQQAVITKDGISFNMQVVQAGNGGNGGGNGNTPTPLQVGSNNGNTLAPSPVVNNTGMATVNLLNNSGIANANVNTGTGNVAQSIANIISINVGFFNVGNGSQVLPALRSWLHL